VPVGAGALAIASTLLPQTAKNECLVCSVRGRQLEVEVRGLLDLLGGDRAVGLKRRQRVKTDLLQSRDNSQAPPSV
jgi:hypothetical protein